MQNILNTRLAVKNTKDLHIYKTLYVWTFMILTMFFCHFTQKSLLIIFNVYLINSAPLFLYLKPGRFGDSDGRRFFFQRGEKSGVLIPVSFPIC